MRAVLLCGEGFDVRNKKWFYPVLLALLTILTAFTVANQSRGFTAEGFFDYVGQMKPISWGVAAACMVGFVLFEALALLEICGSLGYRERFSSGLMYSLSDIYFSAITPSATGGQPAAALFMMRDGIPTAVTTVALLINLAMYTISLLLIAALGFAIRPDALENFCTLSRLLIVIGILMQAALFISFCLLVFRERVLTRIVYGCIGFCEKLHLIRTGEKRRRKLESLERDFKSCTALVNKRQTALLRVLLLNILQRLCVVMVPVIVYLGTGGDFSEVSDVFATQAMVMLGANIIPIPGAVGVTEFMSLDGFAAIVKAPANLELLSRAISFYGCLILCALALIISAVLRRRTGRNTR